MKKILLLGSGELGKELVIALQRLGQYVIACDSYANAPAMQVANGHEVLNMLDGEALQNVVDKHAPDIIVPEIEAIRTEKFYDFEKKGIHVVPSAKAANFTMNRKAIRDLASKELDLKTASYRYATSLEELKKGALEVGIPCVVKPLMSSSGKGQSTVLSEGDVEKAWNDAIKGSRGDLREAIVESFIPFDHEITLLTVTQQNGPTLFCPPIEHVQIHGDYRQSWQPGSTSEIAVKKAREMARKVTEALQGAGVWGVEFFINGDEVYFSELSPRPHDTGMVTMAGTQLLSEFELHARAILGWPIPEQPLLKPGASAVILAEKEGGFPFYEGIHSVLEDPNADIRIFGKSTTRPGRRMGVVLYRGSYDEKIENTVEKAKQLAEQVKVIN